MREPFTRQVRLLLDRAQAAARQLNQDFVSTEHLMLGLLDAGDPAGPSAGGDPSGAATGSGEAVRCLLRESIDLKELRDQIAAGLPKATEEPVVTGNLPLSPRALRVMNLALVKAQAAREAEVSTRSVLRALLEEQDGLLCQSLRNSGVDLDLLQRRLAQPPAERET